MPRNLHVDDEEDEDYLRECEEDYWDLRFDELRDDALEKEVEVANSRKDASRTADTTSHKIN